MYILNELKYLSVGLSLASCDSSHSWLHSTFNCAQHNHPLLPQTTSSAVKTTPLIEGQLCEKLSNHLLKIFLSIPCRASGNQNINKRTTLKESSRAEEVAHPVPGKEGTLGQGSRGRGRYREGTVLVRKWSFLKGRNTWALSWETTKSGAYSQEEGQGTSEKWALHVERHRGIK